MADGVGRPIFSAPARKWALLGFLIAGALILLRFVVVDVPPVGEFKPADRAFVTLWDPPQTKAEIMLDVGDGQAWAALGTDPTYAHPEHFYDGKAEFVYRSQRPVFGWLIWLTSFGQQGLVPLALMLLTALGVGLMVGMSVALAERDQRLTKLVPIVNFLPGTLLVTFYLGPEPLAFAIAMLGVILWTGPPRNRWLAVLAFTVAVLTRDILIVLPVALALWQLVQRRDRIRDLVWLAVPAVAYASWTLSLHQRFGYWPSQATTLERTAPPLRGLIQALPDLPALGWISFVLLVGLVVAALVKRRDSLLTWLAVSLLLPSIVFGQNVWVSEFYRVLLPVYVLTVIVLLPVNRRGAAVPSLRSRASLEARRVTT